MRAKNCLSLATVKKNGFNYPVKMLATLYEVPNLSTITQIIDEKYDVLSLRVNGKLQNTH